MNEPRMIPLPPRFDPGMLPEQAARQVYERLKSRRSVRQFSDRPVSLETIQWVVRAATTAPSGANKQPWRFVCVRDTELKRKIREAAEKEERTFYEKRANERWLVDLEALGTDATKGYLELAPWLVVIMRLAEADDGSQVYYSTESVGIASGMLLAAAHEAGLVTLTHTPSPMKFLIEVLERPANERPFLLVPVGYPADGCQVPEVAIQRKPLDEVMVVR